MDKLCRNSVTKETSALLKIETPQRRPMDTVLGVLSRAVADVPDKTFLDFSGHRLTYSEIDRESNRLAHGLKHLGVKKGDTVTTVLDNHADAVLAWLAINKLGGISVPINTAYKGEYLRHQLADSCAAVMIAEPDYAVRILSVAEGLPELKTVLVRGAVPPVRSSVPMMPLKDAFESDVSAPNIDVRPEDLACLIYTAGTTGPSKGCMISHNYVCNLSWQAVEVIGRRETDITWTPLPLFHFNAVSTTIVSTAMVRGTASIYPRFSLSNFWPEIERTGATIVSLIGPMIPLIGNQADTEVSRRCRGQVKRALGAPFTAEMLEVWRERFGTLYAGANSFGLTESAVITQWPLDQPSPPGSSGKLGPYFEVKIVDDEENELPAGQAGEILVRPKERHVMFEGYWRRPEDTQKLMKNLWFHTGDIGKFDREGFFWFVDRKKDYLRRRGENISSFEIENTFRKHPAIEDVAVHAVLSEMTEDDVKVTAVLKEGEQLAERDLCLWAIENLPYFCVPRYFEFRKDFPRNQIGRILKHQLRSEGKTATTWDIEGSGVELKKR